MRLATRLTMRPLFRILGSLEVEGAGPLGGPQQRELLRRLLLSANAVVSVDRLVDDVWGGAEPPEHAREALQVYVSRLRKAIPDGQKRIRWEQGGYRITVEEDELDAHRFERFAAEGRRLLAAADAAAAASAFDEALGLWRGPVDVEGLRAPDLARLEELRLSAEEDRIDAELARSRERELVAELERLVAQEPLRERRRRQLMLALYRSGRQAEALAAYREARRALVEELGLEPSAELRELEAAILRQDPALSVEPAELGARRRLPAPATALIGRQQEVAEVCDLLGGETRLVTLTGPGGTGKTRVAIQAAYDLAERFADGVSFVELAALRDPTLVLPEIAQTLGLSNGRDPQPALAEHLRERSELLVIDNFEQVDEAAPALSSLLRVAPALKLLVTSRRPLRVYGEHELPLAPMALDGEAVPLFLERARAAGRPLEPSDDVREICRRLDCLPLAIELAAARTRELTPPEMLSLLANRLDLASGGPRDLPARQQTLRATIEWSCGLLEEGERRVFAALGVFAGGCSKEAAAAVCDADPETLTALVEKSLLLSQQGRFAMLETIREYALERLRAGNDEAAARGRHAEYFVEPVVRSLPELKGPDVAAALERLDVEHDNLRAALDWSFEHEPDAFLRAVDALYSFWYFRGHYREGLREFDRARTVASKPATRADVLKLEAALAFACREFSLARPLIDEALLFYRSVEDTVNSVRALTLLGIIATNEGEHERAIEFLEESVALARAGGEEVLGFALANLAHAAHAAGELERAYTASLESVEIHRASTADGGNLSGLGTALGNLGVAELLRGRLPEARMHLAESLSVRTHIQDGHGLVSVFTELAALAVEERESARAARLLGAVDAMRDRSDAELEPIVAEFYERAAAAVRSELGEDSFARLRAEGRALTLEEAAAAALEVD
jgi:predicted ATPase/DNA-binding SARP family transcriptional activator